MTPDVRGISVLKTSFSFLILRTLLSSVCRRTTRVVDPLGVHPFLFQRPEKAHKHLAHKQFLGHPGHRSAQPGTWTKMFMFLARVLQHINL